MPSNFNDVGLFNRKFGFPHSNDGAPRAIPREEAEFRLNFLKEELREIEEAYAAGDLAGVADGLVDLAYVAMGTAHWHHFPWEELWAEVQRANMDKIRVARVEESARGTLFDCRKPTGWKPPDIQSALDQHAKKAAMGDLVCEHGAAMDVHCCGCHSGFIFDIKTCVCF